MAQLKRQYDPMVPVSFSTPWGDTLVQLSPVEGAFLVEYLKDYNHVRAARCLGVSPEQTQEWLRSERIRAVMQHAISAQLKSTVIDKDWLLGELVDNHYLARQMDNLTASNAALATIGKLAQIDAFAADKIQMDIGQELVDRLTRGRERARKAVTLVQRMDGTHSVDDAAVSFW